MSRTTTLSLIAVIGVLSVDCGQPTIRPARPPAAPVRNPENAPPAAATPAPAVAAVPANASLYKRLGGYDALAAVTDDFLRRMLADPKMAAYFEEVNAKGQQRVRQMIVDQLCFATGGPCVYVGADMPMAHKGLNISETAWSVAAGYLTETLDQFRIPAREKAEVLGIVTSLKGDIVGK
ncbi:MAG: group 1 truncated hemoglobin [Gemmatimonadetes bacterium]|nr:group 1 truncated hemoglobin [Gemmatimonadota bacterium]